MLTLQNIVDNYTVFARDDRSEVGLWAIAQSVKEDMGIQSVSEIKNATCEIAKKLMEQNVMPGNLAQKGGFDFWTTSPADSLARIANEWPQTGIPTLASGTCWFALKKT